MKNRYVLIAVAVALFCVAARTQSGSTTDSNSQQAFSLVQATVPLHDAGEVVPPTGPSLFLLDRRSGRVWRYSPPGVIRDERGKSGLTDEYFAPVFVGQTDQDVATHLRESMNRALNMIKMQK
jgi:hypothetical protein